MVVKLGIVTATGALAASLLQQLAGTMGLLAGIVASAAIIIAASKPVWQFLRNVGAVVENTKDLPDFVAEQRKTNRDVTERFAAGDERMTRIEGALEALGNSDAAAIRGAVQALSEPRPPRRTDPAPRTGWRE
jgi:hypothetical protein